MNDRILPKEDEEVVGMLADIMQQEGVQIKTGMKATKVMQKGNNIAVQVESKNGQQEILEGEQLLVAVGRKPTIDGLNLEGIGVETNKKGIVTDRTLRTAVKNIYAAGDVVGPYLFSHYSWYQGMIAARNVCIPIFKANVLYDPASWATFTAPALGTLGLTEKDAREQYSDVTVMYEPYARLDRAITDQATQGLGKYILDKKGRLIGAHILGASAGELLAELHAVAKAKKRFSTIGSIVHVYPTYSELNWHAAKKAYIKELESNWAVKLARKLFFKSR